MKRISNNVLKVLERLPHEEVLKLYSAAWAVVVPSICEEPLPYIVMESMAMGTIPIASRIGRIPEITEGSFAEKMLFTPGNYNELVERIEEVLSISLESLTNIGYKLREHVLKKFSIDTVRSQLLKVFKA